MQTVQTLIRAIYPAQCLLCETRVEEDHGLCPTCRRDAEFLSGALCDCCARPQPGQAEADILCDPCRAARPPWNRGRAALLYDGVGRRLTLALKYGDRSDIALGGAKWMLRAARDIITPDSKLIPVPLHWSRRLKRRYNQSALLAQAMARGSGAHYLPFALQRVRKTPTLTMLNSAERQEALRDAIHPSETRHVAGAHCVLIDDVLTSGATLSACAEALWASGADSVDVVTLARVAQDT